MILSSRVRVIEKLAPDGLWGRVTSLIWHQDSGICIRGADRLLFACTRPTRPTTNNSLTYVDDLPTRDEGRRVFSEVVEAYAIVG